MALFPGLPRWAGTTNVKPIWILLKQETVSGSGISWAICKSAPRYRQITMPALHHSDFYRPDENNQHKRCIREFVRQNLQHSSVTHECFTYWRWVWLYFPLDTKQVILEMFFPANLLTRYWRRFTANNCCSLDAEWPLHNYVFFPPKNCLQPRL